MLFRLILLLFVSVFLLWQPTPGLAVENPVFALWIEAEGKERPFDTKAGFDDLLRFIERGKFTDIYCQVYRDGRSWFPTMLADDTPYRRAVGQGFDPLANLLQFASSKGIRVHAWMNSLRVQKNRMAPMLRILGSAVVHRDNYGNSLLDYDAEGRPPGAIGRSYRLDTPGLWLDPANPLFRRYFRHVIAELLARYPMLDGVHLDMVRFPFPIRYRSGERLSKGLEIGYSPIALERFKHMDGLALKGRNRAERFEEFRRSQVTRFVSDVRQELRKHSGRVLLSVAALADVHAAESRAFQDWTKWSNERLVEDVLPMAYTNSRTRFRYFVRTAREQVFNGRVVAGIGAWLLLRRERDLETQIRVAMQNGLRGVSLFSYGNLAAAQNGAELVELSRRALQPLATER